MHDFTPVKGEKNWSKLGTIFKVEDYLPLPTSDQVPTFIQVPTYLHKSRVPTFTHFWSGTHLYPSTYLHKSRVPTFTHFWSGTHIYPSTYLHKSRVPTFTHFWSGIYIYLYSDTYFRIPKVPYGDSDVLILPFCLEF